MKFEQVGAHSWGCLGGGEDVLHSYGANQGYVVDEGTCLVVDSGFHYGTASQILQRLHRQQPKRLVLVNTHYHSDHVFGNSVLSENGASIIAQEKCMQRMKTRSPILLSRYKARDPRLEKLLRKVTVTYPTITYTDKLKVRVGQVEAQVIHLDEKAHTDGDTMVLIPEDRVIFSGDVLWVGYHPNLEDADIHGQIRALRRILRLKPKTIVPGHGPVCGISEVKRFILYLEEFDRNLRSSLHRRLTLDQTMERSIPAWSNGWKMRGLAENYVRRQWNDNQ